MKWSRVHEWKKKGIWSSYVKRQEETESKREDNDKCTNSTAMKLTAAEKGRIKIAMRNAEQMAASEEDNENPGEVQKEEITVVENG